jgi:hypothetical protein
MGLVFLVHTKRIKLLAQAFSGFSKCGLDHGCQTP